MKYEEGQSISLINVMVMVGLISLAFLMSNYGMLTIVRRLTQTGADAAALAGADYLADNLSKKYMHSCPRDGDEWVRIKDDLNKEGVWKYYLKNYYYKYLDQQDYRWKNEVNRYLNYHQSGEWMEPSLSSIDTGIYTLPGWIIVSVGSRGDSPLTSPALYGTNSIEVHAAAAAKFELEQDKLDFPIVDCHRVSEHDYFPGSSQSKSNVERWCRDQEAYWQKQVNGLISAEHDGYQISCDLDSTTRRIPCGEECERKETWWDAESYFWIEPNRRRIEVSWKSVGLIPMD